MVDADMDTDMGVDMDVGADLGADDDANCNNPMIPDANIYSTSGYQEYNIHPEDDKYLFYNYQSFPKRIRKISMLYNCSVVNHVDPHLFLNSCAITFIKSCFHRPIMCNSTHLENCQAIDNSNFINLNTDQLKQIDRDDCICLELEFANSNMDIVMDLGNLPLTFINKVCVITSMEQTIYNISNLGIFTYNYIKYAESAVENIWILPNLIILPNDRLCLYIARDGLTYMWNQFIKNTHMINSDIDRIIFEYTKIEVDIQILSKSINPINKFNHEHVRGLFTQTQCTSTPIQIHYITESVIGSVAKICIYRTLLRADKTINFMFYSIVSHKIVPCPIFKKLEICNGDSQSPFAVIDQHDIGIFSKVERNHYLAKHKKPSNSIIVKKFKIFDNIFELSGGKHSAVYSINLENCMQDIICMSDDWGGDGGKLIFLFYTNTMSDPAIDPNIKLFLQF